MIFSKRKGLSLHLLRNTKSVFCKFRKAKAIKRKSTGSIDDVELATSEKTAVSADDPGGQPCADRLSPSDVEAMFPCLDPTLVLTMCEEFPTLEDAVAALAEISTDLPCPEAPPRQNICEEMLAWEDTVAGSFDHEELPTSKKTAEAVADTLGGQPYTDRLSYSDVEAMFPYLEARIVRDTLKEMLLEEAVALLTALNEANINSPCYVCGTHVSPGCAREVPPEWECPWRICALYGCYVRCNSLWLDAKHELQAMEEDLAGTP